MHPNDPPTTLTEMELRFIRYAATGLTYAQIAREMWLSTKTIERIQDNLLKKLKLTSRAALIDYAVENGIIPPLPEDGSKHPLPHRRICGYGHRCPF